MKIHRPGKKCRWSGGSYEAAACALIVLASLAQGNELLTAAQRRILDLSYPQESEMGLFFALAVPLDDPVSTKAVSVAFFFEANYRLPEINAVRGQEARRRRTRSIDRRTVYEVLEAKFEASGFPGRQCLLRSICETSARERRDDLAGAGRDGLVGDLMRITFTPSSSSNEDLPPEYARAEGMDSEGDCASIYQLCPFSIYQYITDVLE